MRIANINEAERKRIALDLIGLQHLPSAAMQQLKYKELCERYGAKFVVQFYADLIMQENPDTIPLPIWDWAAMNGTEQHHYAAMLKIAHDQATNGSICEIIRNCCAGVKKYEKRSKKKK